MLDAFDPDLISLTDAAKLLPRVRQGHAVHRTTLWRWSRYGLRGVRLDTLKVGGVVCTSRAALQTFFVEVAKASRLQSDATRTSSSEAVQDRLELELQQRFKI